MEARETVDAKITFILPTQETVLPCSGGFCMVCKNFARQ